MKTYVFIGVVFFVTLIVIGLVLQKYDDIPDISETVVSTSTETVSSDQTTNSPDRSEAFAELPFTDLVTDVTWDFDDGVHTITGVITAPTPCHVVTDDVLVAESYPEQVRITVSLVALSDEFCAQVITDIPFSVQFVASGEAQVVMRLDDGRVQLPAAPRLLP